MDIEIETGTSVRSTPRRHNGYWAGDFTAAPPMPWEQLRRVMDLAPPPPRPGSSVGGGW